MTTYHDGMELGDWQRGAQEAARFDIGLSKVSLQDTPLPSTWDIAKQNFVDSHRTQNIAAAAQNLNTTFDEVNDKIKAATGVSDLFNPMISEASPFMPVKMPDGKLPARPDGDLFEAWKARVRELRTTHPDALNWDEIETEPERRAYQIMKETRERTNTMSQRLGLIEPGQIPYIGNIPLVGATAALGANMMTSPIAAAAQFAGGMAGTITSPVDTAVNLFAGAAGNQAKSIVSNAMKNAYINALAQAPLSAAKQYDYEKAGLPTGWRVWLSEVEGAAAAGFLLDAGVRAPVRAARRAMGAQDLGGVFLDAVPRANLAERPEGMAPIDPKVFEAAASGDLKATREILEKSGALEDPAIRGALDHMETGAKMDAVMIERLKEMGVAESEGFRILSNLLEGGYARAPDRLAADVDAMRNPPQPALKSADVDRVLSVSRAALDQLRADLPQMVEMAVEARIPEVESVIRTAIKSLGEAKPDPARISKQVADEISAVLSDPKTGPRVADTVRITSGAASASEMAAIVRRSPDLKRYLNPEIDRPRQALALSTLDDASFGRVLSGEIPAPLAAHVADTVNPKHHATVLDDVARAKPQSIDELRQLLDELPPREDAEPLLKSGASGIDDPAGPKAKAQLEAMKVDQAAAIEEATAALKERDKIASKVEGLQGEVAKLVDKPDLSEADAMKLAKARAELAELEPQLERLKADTSPDQAGAQAMYRIAMMAYHQRREADVFRAVNHALELARKITPSDTKIEVKPELRQDGIVLDAASDIDTGNIALAIRAVDPDARMGHEALHTLVTKGLISPAEVAELAALARENGTFANEAKYREAYADRPNLERQIEEEAAASYVEAVVRGDIKQAENTIANRVKDFIERIKNLLKGYGFKTRDDIVTALLNGDMARREPVRQWMRENDISALAVRPDAGVMFAMADRETGQSMRRDMDALGYVSQALEAARALKQAKGTPEQMLAQLRSAGVKQAEIEATNLGQFLDGKKSITRDEIVGHLEANRVGLREVGYGLNMDAASVAARAELAAIEKRIQEIPSGTRENPNPEYDRLNDRRFEVGQIIKDKPTKWSSYSLDPSNPTYRETVLHLPESVDNLRELRNAELDRIASQYGHLSNAPAEERAAFEALSDRAYAQRPDRVDFRSGHFPEPNIIGHMMTSMVKHEGKPTYLIDQIQSDWGQKLRDGGVRDEAKIAELERRLGEAQDKLDAGMVSAPKGDPYAQVPFGYDRPIPAELNDIYQQVQLLGAELETAKQSPTGHPLVNTTDQWTVTTLRRALRQAAEADASYIAIPHGDTVLSYNPEGTEGPEGMRKFYGTSTSNAIVPKNLRNIIQKLDKDAPSPIRVKMLETPTRGMANRGDLKISDGGSDFGFTLFPLTDKIKQEVTQRGQVMFAFAGPKATTARRDMLKLAERMESKGRKPEHIFKQTGWFRGHDKLWRFEIDDSNALLQDLDAISKPWTNRPKDAPTGKDLRIIDAAPLKDVLDHPALFAAYPFLEKMPVRVIYGDSLPAELNQTGKFSLREIGNRRSMSVTVRGRSVIEVHRALLHELQHYIQTKEGWDAGASPKNFTPGGIDARRPNRGTDLFPLTVGDRMVLWHEEKLQELQRDHAQGRMKSLTENDSLRSLNKSAAEQMRMGERGYSKSPGEAEANLTMERGALTAEERRDAFPMAQWPRDLDPAAPVQFSKWRPAIEAAQDALARTKGYRKRYFAPQMVGDRTRMSRLEQANLVEDRINFDWLGSDGTPAVRVEVREYPFSGTAEYMGERILRDYSSNSSDEAVSIMALQPAERAAFVDDIERGLRERNLRMVVNTERMDADEAAWWWSRNEANGDQDPRRFISDVEDALYEKHGNGVVLKPGNGYGEDWSFSVTGMLGRKKKFKTEEFGVVEDVWLDGDELWGMINAARKRRGEISRDDVANEYRGIDRAIIDDMRRDDKGGLVMFAFSGFKKPVDRSDRMAHVVMRRLTDKNGKTFLARVVEQGEDLRIEMYGDRSPETPESELSRGASRHGPLLGSVDLSYQGIGRLATHGHRGPLYEVQYVTVYEKQRMRGLAKATYDMIEEMLGTEMAPSGTLLPDGYAHWKKRNPELVRGHQYHREFEQYMSPRNIKYQLDSAERAAREFNREAEIDGHIGNLRARFERNLRALIAQGVDEDAIRNGGTDAIEKALSESRIDFASGDLPWTVKDALRRDGRDAVVKVLAKEIDLARFRTADGPARADAEYLVDERAKSNRQELAILRGMWRKVPADLRSEKARQAMFAFAGERAKTADLEALARAKEMTADGVDRTKIWQDTGWFLGVDGKWKWEIDDSAMTLNAPVKRGGYIGNAQSTLGAGDIVSHEKLIDAYPELANLPVRVDGGRHVGSHFWPGKDAQKSALVIADYMTYRPEWRNKTAMDPNQVFMSTNGPYTFRSTAAHELQHAVGSIDGSLPPQGLGTRVFSTWEEVEARAVQKRMNLTPEERRARPPWMDYDVPEDQQIVRFADGSGPMFAFAESTPQSRAKVSEEIKRIINDRTQRQPGERLGTGEQDSGPGARQARFGRALDGQPDPSLGRGQSAQGPSAEGATGAGESRLPVTEILRNAVWDHIGDRLTPEQARSRKEAQGFTINAWHATFKTFDTPDPFRPLRDFGFHVAVGKPDAANERLGFAVTFHAKLDAFVAKVLGVAEKSWYAKRENKGDEARIMALAVKSHNPLRLPDLIQWEMPGQWKEGLNPDNSPAWLRDWVRNWFIDNNAYSITQQQFLAQSHKFSRDVAAELERRGYDGIVYTKKAEAKGQDSLLVWNPAQVRSAFDAFDERAANDVGLRASDKYIEQDIRAIANRVMQEEGLAQPNLMFAMADTAQPEPPKRPIEQDYAVIDRLQKMNELIEACR
jgi:hypothetical protein